MEDGPGQAGMLTKCKYQVVSINELYRVKTSWEEGFAKSTHSVMFYLTGFQ